MWEYKVFEVPREGWDQAHIVQEMDALGKKDWELVCALDNRLYFKRPLKPVSQATGLTMTIRAGGGTRA